MSNKKKELVRNPQQQKGFFDLVPSGTVVKLGKAKENKSVMEALKEKNLRKNKIGGEMKKAAAGLLMSGLLNKKKFNILKRAKGDNKNLKKVPAEKMNSLGKLPTEVRNKMGYAKYGKIMKARYGTMAKESTGPALQKEKVKKEQREIFRTNLVKELAGAQISDKERENIMNLVPKTSDNARTIQAKRAALKMIQKKFMGGSMDKGYGAARSKGMGLQDEDLVPGKSLDYYSDLID